MGSRNLLRTGMKVVIVLYPPPPPPPSCVFRDGPICFFFLDSGVARMLLQKWNQARVREGFDSLFPLNNTVSRGLGWGGAYIFPEIPPPLLAYASGLPRSLCYCVVYDVFIFSSALCLKVRSTYCFTVSCTLLATMQIPVNRSSYYFKF